MVNIHEAKTQLSRLLAQVAKGEEIIIARAGKPIARLIPYSGPITNRTLGKDAGLFEVPDDFDQPLPDDVLDGFED